MGGGNILTISILLIFIPLTTLAQQQRTVLSESWIGVGGQMAVFHKNATKTDGQGNVYVVGSTIANNNTHNIILQKFDPDGILQWQKTYNGQANMDDYAADLFIDNNQNVYVTGASTENSSDSYDLVALKYEPNGVFVWEQHYNYGGSPVPKDGGAAITGDNNGGIYVTGASTGNGSMGDYATLKINANNGSIMWANRYDYNGLNDAAVTMRYVSGKVIVSGGSQINANPNEWEMASITYEASSGSQLNVRRSGGSAAEGIDEINDMAVGPAGNIYLTGAVETANNAYNISLYKLDQNLNIIWQQTFDGEGLDDKGNGIKVDGQGNIYIAGYSTTSSTGKDFALLKYSNAGTFLWDRAFNGKTSLDDEAVDLVIDYNTNRIYVTGSANNTGNLDYQTVAYKPDGSIVTQISYAGSAELDDKPSEIAIDLSGDLIVVGQEEVQQGLYENMTVKYDVYNRSFYVDQGQGQDTSKFVKGELLIRFDSKEVKKQAVDNTKKQAGSLRDFIKTSAINAMNSKLGINCNSLETYKIFTRMTSADTTSISRTGDTVSLKNSWATFAVYFNKEIDVSVIADSLNTMYPTIYYAEKDYYAEFFDVPNDPLYSTQQTGLFNPTHGINAEEAWDTQKGNNNVKVGVFDSGINWRHEDFGDGTISGTKVIGGWDYFNNANPFNQQTPDPNGHGTACAGIIGALRNNNTGIAGIAGGDVQNNNTGAKLYSMRISDSAGIISTSAAVEAIVEGATNSTNSDFGEVLDVQNHSWGGPINSISLQNAVETCFINECIFSAASGNDYDQTINYPASYNDAWVLKVGANEGITGSRANFSTYGNDLDFIAPGTSDIYATLDHDDNSGYTYNGDGTSFAAPHVAGVTALLQSEHHIYNGYPNGLAPEDVEYFLENFASTPYSGYNQEIGFGRVNANLSLERLSFPDYYVFHGGGQATPLQTTAAGLSVIVSNNTNGVAAGYYTADRYQVTYNFIDIFPVGQTVIDNWTRYSSSVGVSAANPISGETWFNFTPTINQNVVSVSATTFCWYILHNSIGQSVNKWIPAPPSQLKTSYSLYVKDPNSTASVDEENLEEGVNIYPNPSDDQITIEYNLSENTDVHLEILDATGRKIATHEMQNQSIGKQSLTVSVSHLSNGIYICNLNIGNDIISRKIIKK